MSDNRAKSLLAHSPSLRRPEMFVFSPFAGAKHCEPTTAMRAKPTPGQPRTENSRTMRYSRRAIYPHHEFRNTIQSP
jgi:hypothetical protein